MAPTNEPYPPAQQAPYAQPYQQYQQSYTAPQQPRVIVTDVDMTIGSMCRFMVKWAIASIPAVIILCLLYGFCALFFAGCMTAMFHH